MKPGSEMTRLELAALIAAEFHRRKISDGTLVRNYTRSDGLFAS